ncbi:SPX and EXS domain-containing protein 5-like isoform X4 [Macadamia integrifolia]|uniref:SPX and EXS domain-containing protein 5-like isoform X4 n=1 Tax=Macadamia integrifolia TaxID=60698 RepID=UPI001C4EC6EE|nr:SPX and EXS domain-containing protein 5-like isoform X4 [Macadamia integrifolia]
MMISLCFESSKLKDKKEEKEINKVPLGSSDPGNSLRHFQHQLELNETKGGSLPLHATTIMPSPIFFWRFKTMMVWLWGVNLWVFAQSTINYAKIFDLSQDYLTHREIWKCATWMTIIVPTSMTAYLYLYSHGEVSLAASQPVLLYASVIMIFVFPFEIIYLSSRYYFLRTLWRIILPVQVITFSDFFVADILTSMAKVLSDLERSVCRMVHRQVATIAWFEANSVCGSHSIAIPLVLVFPYMCRFFQCLRQHKDTKDKAALLNALKYSTAVPVMFLSALKYHVFPDKWINIYHPLWLLSSFINSLYSFYWDVTRDWDMRYAQFSFSPL